MEHFDAYISLLLGGGLAIWIVADFVKSKTRSYAGVVLYLSMAMAWMALGLLNLFGLVAGVWVWRGNGAITGIMLIITGMTMTGREKSSWVVLGIIVILVVLASALMAFFS